MEIMPGRTGTALTILFQALVIGLVAGSVCLAASGLEVAHENDPLYGEILAAANKWKDALFNKDIDALVSFALPETRDQVEHDLRYKKSDLYRLFYDGPWNRREGRSSICFSFRTRRSGMLITIFLMKTQGTMRIDRGEEIRDPFPEG